MIRNGEIQLSEIKLREMFYQELLNAFHLEVIRVTIFECGMASCTSGYNCAGSYLLYLSAIILHQFLGIKSHSHERRAAALLCRKNGCSKALKKRECFGGGLGITIGVHAAHKISILRLF